jgi:hypothetical protein
MSSTASGLNALASTTAIDIYKRNLKERNQKSTISTRQSFYLVLGCSHSFASVGTLFENLIQQTSSVPYSTERYWEFSSDFTSNSSKPKPSLQCPGQPNHHFLYTTMPFCFPAGEAGLFMAKLHQCLRSLSSLLQLSVLERKG